MRNLSRFLAVLLLVLSPVAAFGQGLGLGFGRTSSEPVKARAQVSVTPLVTGKDAEIAVEMTVARGFHVQSSYAVKPNIAAALTIKAVDGISTGPIRYPLPKDIPSPAALGSGTLSVYDGQVYFLIPVSVAKDAAAGDREMEIDLLSQACDDEHCDPPKTIKLKVPLKIGAAGESQTQNEPALFEAAHRQEFAAEPPEAGAANSASEPAATTTQVTAGPGRTVQLLSSDAQVNLIEQRDYRPFNAAEQEHSVAGIFLLALAGGLILNVMPCVLPVIPLKALSLVQQAHGDRRLAMVHGLTFAAGVVTLFVALAVLLKTFGLFYGQQFQSPVFLITMTMFVVALALSMLGVWTINPPQAVYSADAAFGQRHGLLSSFGNGLMATILATPCSAPFLGGVLAWALVHPAWLTAVALAMVGVGMSLPYLLLAIFPGLLSRFPRAGRWSELVKQGLGIVMLGVAVYLVTLVPRVQLWPWVMAGAVVTALACWGWGQIPSPLMERPRIWGIRAVVVIIGALLGLGVYKIGSAIAQANEAMTAQAAAETAVLPDKTTGAWLPFNVALLDAALKDGRPVVVDWTADWCPNCHALEALVLSRQAVNEGFAANRAVLLRADLSSDNPPATALNHKLGGEAIPVLAIFAPSRPTEPVVLRDSYTQARVIGEVQSAR